MRRVFYTAIIILLSFTARTQQIELLGSYSAFFIGGETITFKGTDSFYFTGWYCTDGVYGRGRCEIENGNLYLYFSAEPETKKNIRSHEVQKVITSDSKKLVEISCRTTNDEKIGYSSLKVKLQNGTEVSYLTDTTGYIKFAIDSDEFPVTIQSEPIGSAATTITLKEPAEYSLKLFHQNIFESLTKTLHNGEVFVYEIVEVSEDRILMRRGKGGRPYEYKKRLNP